MVRAGVPPRSTSGHHWAGRGRSTKKLGSDAATAPPSLGEPSLVAIAHRAEGDPLTGFRKGGPHSERKAGRSSLPRTLPAGAKGLLPDLESSPLSPAHGLGRCVRQFVADGALTCPATSDKPLNGSRSRSDDANH